MIGQLDACKVEIKNDPHIEEYLKQLQRNKQKKIVSCTDLRHKLQRNRIKKKKSSHISIKEEPIDDSYGPYASSEGGALNALKKNNVKDNKVNKKESPSLPRLNTSTVGEHTINAFVEREAPSLENMLSEDELLGDIDSQSTVTDCLNEDELLNEDEYEAENLQEQVEVTSPTSKGENKAVDVQSPTEKVSFHDEMFDTMSIAATENEFNEECTIDKAPKKRGSSETSLPPPKRSQSVEDKVSEWQQGFKIPKMGPQPAKNQQRNSSRKVPVTNNKNPKKGFAKPAPYRGILSTPTNPARPINKSSTNEESDLRSVISQSKTKGQCFKFLRQGSCEDNNCRYLHSQPNKQDNQRKILPGQASPPPSMNDLRKSNNPIQSDFKDAINTLSKINNSLYNSSLYQYQLMRQNGVGIGAFVPRQPGPQMTTTRHSFPPNNFPRPNLPPGSSNPELKSSSTHIPANVQFNTNVIPSSRVFNNVPLPIPINTTNKQAFNQDQNVMPNKVPSPIDNKRPQLQKPKDIPGQSAKNVNQQGSTHFQITQTTRRDSSRSFGNTPHNQDFRNLSLNQLIDEFDKTNNLETKWKITQRLDDTSLGPQQQEKYLTTLENLLLLLRENGSARSLEIARKIFVAKRQMNCLKREDFYILAELESKGNNINKTMDHLTEYKAKFNRRIEFINSDNEELLFYSIEPNAKITRFWEDFRMTALQSDRVLDRMLCTFSETKLTELFTSEDITIIFKKMMEISNINLSPSAKTTILFLLSTTDDITHMIGYIDKHSDSILQITQPIAFKVLDNIPNLPNIIDCLPVLRKLIRLVDPKIWREKSSEKLWNQLLSYAYRKDLVQFSEQIYGIMEEVKVKPNIECSMMMLSGLCKNRFFQVFEKRCHDLYKLSIFPESFKYPTSFAQEISEALQEYDGDDKNIIHHMILFLISSDCPPTENNITDVLDMLISKRRFSEVYSLILKCFDANIILSQKDLRRSIFALEEWMQNVKASIKIYEKMRQFYTRPEHQCICGSDNKPLLSQPLRHPSTGELASPKSSTGSNQEGSSEHVDSFRHLTTTHLLSRISAELNAFSKDISKFTDTYEQAYNNNYGNHDKILVGLFLGLTETDRPDSFQQFVVQLFTKFDDIPPDVETALGRVGLRLIKRFFDRNLWNAAVETIEVFHSYSIRYANAIEGFGTQIQTKDDLTSCEIADLCCRCCIYAKKPFTACAVFSHCDHCIIKDELTKPQNDILENLMSDLVGALSSEYPEKTITMLTSTHQNLSSENLKVMVNMVLESLVNTRNLKPGDIAKGIEQLTPIFEKTTDFLLPKTTKALVYFYVTYNQWANAKKYFDEGRRSGIYSETFFDTQPFLAEIKTGMTAGEIFLTIESHLIELINHPVYCIGEQLKQPVDLVIAPGSDLDGDQFQSVLQQTMRELGRVLAKEFAPPLQVLDSKNQKYVVCPRSITEWYAQRKQRIDQNDTDRYLNHNSNKRSVDIQGGSKSDIKIQFCPTPMDQASESDISVVNTSVNAGEKRILKTFPITQNSSEASHYIRKITCTYLNLKYLKNGYLPAEDFKATAKELFEAFIGDLKKEKGYIYYDKYINFRVQDYIDCYFNNQNDGSENPETQRKVIENSMV